jgi:uncharacterized membrane protein YjjP (DUF1212 family)
MIKSWKTTAAGITAIVSGLAFAFSQYLSGGVAAVNWEVLLAAVISGIGLIMAKDSGVSNASNPGPAVKVVGPGA